MISLMFLTNLIKLILLGTNNENMIYLEMKIFGKSEIIRVWYLEATVTSNKILKTIGIHFFGLQEWWLLTLFGLWLGQYDYSGTSL